MNSVRILFVAGIAALAPLAASAGPSGYRNDQFGTTTYNPETSVIYGSFQLASGADVQRRAAAVKPHGAEGPVRANAGMEEDTVGDALARLGGIGGANTP